MAGDFIQPAAQARQLVWNRGAGLQRDSPILQVCCRLAAYAAMLHLVCKRRSTLQTILHTVACPFVLLPVAECHTCAHPCRRTRPAFDAHVDTGTGIWHGTGRSILLLIACNSALRCVPHGLGGRRSVRCVYMWRGAWQYAAGAPSTFVAVDKLLAAIVCRPNCKGLFNHVSFREETCNNCVVGLAGSGSGRDFELRNDSMYTVFDVLFDSSVAPFRCQTT